jgi:hypothetical protein
MKTSAPNNNRASVAASDWFLWGSQCEKSSRAILGVEVTAGGDDGGVAEGSLHQVNGRPSVEGMGGVGMPHPVRGNRQIDAGANRPAQLFQILPDRGRQLDRPGLVAFCRRP